MTSTGWVDRTRRRTDRAAANTKGARRSSGALTRTLAQIAIVIVWLIAWHLTSTRGWIDPVLASAPIDSWNYVVQAWGSGELLTNTISTLSAALLAWVIAGGVGVLAGLSLGLLPRVERVLNPFIDALNAMPRIALAPLFIVAFGIGLTGKVALAVTLVFFIVLSGARAGVRSADGEWLRLSTAMGAKPWQLFTKVFFPVAVPAIFAALRLGLIYSLLGVVGSELIAAESGLGQLVANYSATFQMEAVYAILILLAIIAVILNAVMGLVEARLLRWQAPVER